MSNQNTLAEQEQAKMNEFFNPTTEQRQAKMRLMMARMKEPEYQADVAEADAVVERVAEADADVSECLNLDDRNIPSERMLRKSQLAQAKQAQADAVIALEELRGDNLATQAPTTTPVVTAPVVTAAVERDAGAPVPMADAPAKTPAPLPLTTGDIAHCFALLRWNEQQWKDTLGEVKSRKWLQECVVIPSSGRGGNETRWNPVFIAGWLVQQGHVTCRSARAKFQVNSLLNHWLDEWKTYEADNLESD